MVEYKHSKWLNVDLHIHSIKSNEKKDSDYKGKKYNGKEIIDKLISNSISIFSVTDHNSINTELYKEIFMELKRKEYEKKINVLIGVELDITDLNVHKEMFHALCIFKSTDYDLIEKAIEELISGDVDIDNIFKCFHKNELFDFLLIPHFNNKSRGLPSNKNQINNLNRLIFNAYEDSNNSVKLTESLKVYLSNGFDTFPFVAFSDCHRLEDYPGKKKDGSKHNICSMLGNIEYPFNTVKTAFEEPQLRISIENVDLMRSNKQRFNSIIIKDKDNYYKLSSYLNTIIGSFGSGKSLLLDKILNGIKDTDKKYSKIVNSNDEFYMVFDENKVYSLKEAISKKIFNKLIHVKQYEDLVYVDIIDKNYMEKLSKQLDFNFPIMSSFEYESNKDDLFLKVDDLAKEKELFKNSMSFNYSRAFKKNISYNIKSEPIEKIDYENLKSNINSFNFETIKSLTIKNFNVFNDKEIEFIEKTENILFNKVKTIENIYDKSSKLFKLIEENISQFNRLNDFQTDIETKDSVSNILNKYYQKVLNLKEAINNFDKYYNEEIYDKLKATTDIEELDDYELICKFNIDTNDKFISLSEKMYTSANKINNDLFKNIYNSLSNDINLRYNKEFSSNFKSIIDQYIKDVKSIFNSDNVIYDIYLTDRDKSILDLSPGERAKEILNLVFNRINRNISEKKSTIVIIDQPENNLDNKNILEEIVNKIKGVKLLDRNNLVTFILVTHNANVCITSDSENILIAENNKKIFFYENGSIENEIFIDKVCSVLEGGEQALLARTSKYNLGVKRKVEKR